MKNSADDDMSNFLHKRDLHPTNEYHVVWHRCILHEFDHKPDLEEETAPAELTVIRTAKEKTLQCCC
jgi:hypothetical protein